MSSIPHDMDKYAHRLFEMMHKQLESGQYFIFPSTLSEKAQEENKEKIRFFLKDLNSEVFQKFITELKSVCAVFEKAQKKPDADAAGDPLVLAKLKSVYGFLNTQGFYGVAGRPVSFWSGKAAKEKAREEYLKTGQLSDAEVPALSVLFNIVSLLEAEYTNPLSATTGVSEENKNLAVLLPDALSRIYALESVGEVHVYISSDKRNEPAALTMGNNFWNAELYILRQREKIAPIWLHLHTPSDDLGADEWPKINLNDQNELEKINLIVRRKLAYSPRNTPKLEDSNPQRFRKPVMQPEEYKLWTEHPSAQAGIPYLTLKKFAKIIKQKAVLLTQRKHNQKKTASTFTFPPNALHIDSPSDSEVSLSTTSSEKRLDSPLPSPNISGDFSKTPSPKNSSKKNIP